MTPSQQRDMLLRLSKFLRSMCHAPDCTKVTTCPHICGCRTRRTFKTNTETAVCWELARQIELYCKGRGYVRNKVNLESFFLAYLRLSEYHMTEGWGNFFNEALRIVYFLFHPEDYTVYNAEHRLEQMKYVRNRLKREPKD